MIFGKSLPAWGAWIEIFAICCRLLMLLSLPAWGAWIEILLTESVYHLWLVAPRVGSVD